MIPTHLEIRPSASKRWLACPGSTWVATAVAQQPAPDEGPAPPGTSSSFYAAEGTRAHAHLAAMLTNKAVEDFLEPNDPASQMAISTEDIQLLHQMAELVQGMAMLEGQDISCEVQLQKQFSGHQISGTADILMVSDTRLTIADLKWGAGVRVDVEANPQLTLYGLMALAKYPGRELELVIIQPRGIGRGLTTWVCSPDYLLDFEDNVLAAIRRAYVAQPAFNIGPWCSWCAGKDLGLCPARLWQALQFAVGAIEDPTAGMLTLTPAWGMLEWGKVATDMVKGLESEAKRILGQGGQVPGWALVNQAARRRWANAAEVPDVFAQLTGADRSEFCTTIVKPIGIAEAERHPLLKGKPLDLYIDKPVTRVLVPADEVPDLLGEV